MSPLQHLRRWLIARAIRRIIVAFRIGRAHGAQQAAEIISGVMQGAEGSTITAETTPLALETAPREPGRQPISIGVGEFIAVSDFAAPRFQVRPWTPPDISRSAPFERLHRFMPGVKVVRDPVYGLLQHEPPLALICPACELEQPPLTNGERSCPYCGLKLKVHGTAIFWWREPAPDVPHWAP